MRLTLLALLGFSLSFLTLPEHAQAEPAAFELKEGDRIVFLGSELTEQEIKNNLLEAALSSHWATRTLSFRNLGWAGDDPTCVARGYFNGAEEGYRRTMEEMDRIKPTVIFVAYGENGAYSGAAGLPGFMESYTRLINDLKKHTDRIVIVSPPPAEKHPAPLPDPVAVNNNRQAMTAKLKEFASAGNYQFVNLFEPLRARLEAGTDQLTYDTLRFTPAGYGLLASTTLTQLGITPDPVGKADPTLLEMIRRKNDLFFHRYRPQNETYLRGFRKHEQGQNAKEIPEFDPLIQRTEEQIAAFLQGKPAPANIAIPEPAPLEFKALSTDDQKATFKLADGLEISIFASEPMVANPIQMNFDGKGRLWVASSPIYPQLRPGASPNDTIIILEDTNGDGVADKKTQFADNLLIPTAILPDELGGAFVANSTELIHIADTDGDGIGDERHVLLSGFGTEDTHHILHTFRWSPDALLAFNQSIYIHTHMETPYGVQKMLGSGIWRYRQQTARANSVMFGMVNPWGHIYDDWGQSFATDGAGGEGINYAFPGSAYLSAVGYDRILKGMNPGQPKHCGLEIITGGHFPPEWKDSLVAADFRGNRINRFQLSPQGSGYVSKQIDDLLSCSDRAFRPVDMKLGPDGTLYIADWHDSIINHGEVDFRDPRRDDRHGRIWRITAKGRPTVTPPKLDKATIPQLLALLKAPEQWTRQMARVHLSHLDGNAVATALTDWVAGLNPQEADFERLRLEALWVYQGTNHIPPAFLSQLLVAPDARVRAAAVRVLSQSQHEDYGLAGTFPVIEALTTAISDTNPQVRLEAVNALRDVGTAQAADLAMRALDQDADQYIDYALYITMRALQAEWLPRLENGQAEFKGNLNKTIFALKAIDNASALKPLMELLTSNRVPADRLSDVLGTIGKFADKPDAKILFERAISKPEERGALLGALATASQRRNLVPDGELPGLKDLLTDGQGIRLIGLWKQKQFQPQLIAIVEDSKMPTPIRHAAVDSLRSLGEQATLERLASEPTLAIPFRRLAIINLIPLNAELAASKAADFLVNAKEGQDSEVNEILTAFLGAKSGPEQLAAALKSKKISAHIATLGVRKSSSSGELGKPLVEALRTAGGLAEIPKALTPEQMNAVVAEVASQGDAKRGEVIYRRKDLTCMTCHSLGGAGGLVGPDMLSLGASSPVDYIIQSLLEPSAKIKEGYHTVTVATVDGKVVNGVMVREGSDDLVLRDIQNREIAIPKGDIEERANNPTSIMPADLTAKLAKDEFLDLVAFLSSLGKEGDFKVPNKRFVRRWVSKGGNIIYSQVNGAFPVSDAPERTVSFTIQVTTAGKIGLKPNELLGLYLVHGDGNNDLLSKEPVTVLELPVGLHTFHLSMFGHRKNPVAIEIVDVEGSAGRADVVNR